MTTEVKSFLGFGNIDKGLIQDDWTWTEPFEVLLEMDETFLAKKDEQDNKDMIMLPEGLFPNSLDYGFDDERTLEIDNGQSDPIESLSVHGLKTLRNHFSKVTAATSVNDVIAVNVTNTNLQKWIMMARDMDITVDNMTNILLGKKPNIRKDILEDWLIGVQHSPNRNTELTSRGILRHSETIQKLNGKQARQSLFLSQRTNRYTEKDADNLNKVLLPNETIDETVDGKLCRSNEVRREIWAQNVFDMPIAGMLLSLNHRTTRQRRNNLLFYITAFGLSIHPKLLLADLSRPLNSELVVEDHGSIVGVTTTLEIHTDGTTTIFLSTQNKQYESSDKSYHETHSAVMHKSAFELTTDTTYLPW